MVSTAQLPYGFAGRVCCALTPLLACLSCLLVQAPSKMHCHCTGCEAHQLLIALVPQLQVLHGLQITCGLSLCTLSIVLLPCLLIYSFR